jgi:uncharacterized protein (TIGR03083 family)
MATKGEAMNVTPHYRHAASRDVATIGVIGHAEAMALAATENDRFVAAARCISDDGWRQPTDNDEWDVRAMTLHVLGTWEGNASVRQNIHQMRLGRSWAKKRSRPLVDGINQVQIDERRHLTDQEIVDGLARNARRAVTGRARVPSPMRKLKTKVEMPYGTERWSLGFLLDIVYTRDTWMHRVDLARATETPLELDDEHDRRIVEDVVAEWARRHGQPFTLVLTGPAGGSYASGSSDVSDALELDAVEFCRIVSGRERGSGLLAQEVAF